MKVLVTGGSGTVGRWICKQLIKDGSTPIVMSRDLATQLEYCHGCGHEVGDVENYCDIERVLVKHEIDGVIHAAANKHVNLCETRPSLAVSANIIGTHNVLQLAREFNMKKVVVISSDKSCARDQVYGISKYLGERLAEEYAADGLRVNTVRFGNVFGSSGSVVPIWKKLINEGKDIELRWDDMVYFKSPLRFALLPSEAAEFCCKVFFGEYEPGAIITKSMRVVDIAILANVMIAGTKSKIVYKGLQGGEQLSECLLATDEYNRARFNDGEWVITRRKHAGIYPSGNADLTIFYEPGSWTVTNPGLAMDVDDTIRFLAKVLKEM